MVELIALAIAGVTIPFIVGYICLLKCLNEAAKYTSF